MSTLSVELYHMRPEPGGREMNEGAHVVYVSLGLRAG